jgi:hypothetical protein
MWDGELDAIASAADPDAIGRCHAMRIVCGLAQIQGDAHCINQASRFFEIKNPPPAAEKNLDSNPAAFRRNAQIDQSSLLLF